MTNVGFITVVKDKNKKNAVFVWLQRRHNRPKGLRRRLFFDKSAKPKTQRRDAPTTFKIYCLSATLPLPFFFLLDPIGDDDGKHLLRQMRVILLYSGTGVDCEDDDHSVVQVHSFVKFHFLVIFMSYTG